MKQILIPESEKELQIMYSKYIDWDIIKDKFPDLYYACMYNAINSLEIIIDNEKEKVNQILR